MGEKVVEALKWLKRFIQGPPAYREKIKNLVLANVSRAPGDKNTEWSVSDLKKLAARLGDKAEYDFVGVTPNIIYVKTEADDPKDLEAVFVHPFGTETLLFASKKLPYLILVNPGIRFNKSFLDEMPLSKKAQRLLGIVG